VSVCVCVCVCVCRARQCRLSPYTSSSRSVLCFKFQVLDLLECWCYANDTYRVGQNHIHTRCIHGFFGRDITKYTVIYGVHIWF